MEPVRIIEVKESVFANNNQQADSLRARLKENRTFLLNLSPLPAQARQRLCCVSSRS